MSYIILDLDNCISDDSWRLKKINWKDTNPFMRYHEYQLLAGFDRVWNEEIFKNTEHDIIVFTARPVHYAAIAFQWMKLNDVAAKIVMMRPNSDYSPSTKLKAKQLCLLHKKYKISVDDIVCAYDDREDVIEMYRSRGLTACIAKIHNNTNWPVYDKEQRDEYDN